MLQHLKGYQKSIRLIKTGPLNKKPTQISIHNIVILAYLLAVRHSSISCPMTMASAMQ